MRTSSVACILCEGPLNGPVFENIQDRLGVSKRLWTFRRCQKCGSAILDPMPSQQELLNMYPEYYAFAQAPQTHWAHHLLHILEMQFFYGPIYRHSVRQVQRVTGLKQGRLLDVGGGTGNRAAFFQRAGFDCTVLDPDPRALKIAQERFGLPTVEGLLETASIPEESFDLITFYAVVEHLPNPVSTLRAAYRLLRPGGWIVTFVPLLAGWQLSLGGQRWHQVREAPRHVSLPTTKGMQQLLQRAGFEPKCWEREHPLDEAGIFALSLVPFSASAVAHQKPSLVSRVGRRFLGALVTLLALPGAYLAYLTHRTSTGTFFAQKPHLSSKGSTQSTI